MSSWGKLSRKEKVLALVSDGVGQLFYYSRKECEEFPVGSIEDMLKSGEVTVDEMVAEFRKNVESNCPEATS